MTDQELQQSRRAKWQLSGHPVRTFEEGASFLESVGFCLLYPNKPPLLVPTFVGACSGSDENLPTWQHAYANPRAIEATELMVRLLRQRAVFEANLFDGNNAFLIAASVFPYFYALVGDRNPKLAPKPGPRAEFSQLVCDTFEVIRRDGPISKQKLGERLGGGISSLGLDHAVNELWSHLRITRVDYKPTEGAVWDVLYRWAPDQVREGVSLSVGESLSALVSKYLGCLIAADQEEVENFLSRFVARSKVKEAISALLVARELSFVYVGNKSLLQVTPPRVPVPAGTGTQRRPVRR